jgi:hypothetical protein
MKKLYILSCVGVMVLGACASNPSENNSVQVARAPMPIHSESVSKRLNACIVRSNQSADALLVDSQIIAVTRNNPHAKSLFSSPDKLTDQQAQALTNYLAEANTCRPIALEGVNPEMTAVYQDFFKRIDALYADLIARKITIGVANQERQLLIQDAHLKRVAIQTKSK